MRFLTSLVLTLPLAVLCGSMSALADQATPKSKSAPAGAASVEAPSATKVGPASAAKAAKMNESGDTLDNMLIQDLVGNYSKGQGATDPDSKAKWFPEDGGAAEGGGSDDDGDKPPTARAVHERRITPKRPNP